MAFGSVFSKFKEFQATTADEKIINIKNSFITRLGFKILGVPHIGIRIRARKIIKNSKNKINSLLDAGCGTGAYSFYFSHKADRINAVDISKEKINYLNKENIFRNINFSIADLCSLPFSKNSFDEIICSDVLEHIKNDKKAISELARVLKKDGILLITVPYKSKSNMKSYKQFNHERAGYTWGDFESISEKLRLKITTCEGYSYPTADKISNFSYKFINKKIILGIIFYPLYLAALLFDFFKIDEPNGLFVKFKKI